MAESIARGRQTCVTERLRSEHYNSRVVMVKFLCGSPDMIGVPRHTHAGMGSKRIRAVRESLAGRFQRRTSQQQTFESTEVNRDVPVAELLELDREYRLLDKQRKLPRIAPRRFNPTREAWLPVWHPVKGRRHYTVLYSNTARAHEMGTTHDWVVIYRDDDTDHGRWTVITANYGRLRGRRIVRGREDECAEFYQDKPKAAENRP